MGGFVLDTGVPRRNSPEDRLQERFVHWKRWWTNYDPANQPYVALAFLHSIPNGGYRDPKTANLLKRTGGERGAPDLFWPYRKPVGNGERSFLMMETKAPGGRQSKEQRAYEDFVRAHTNGSYILWSNPWDLARLVCEWAGWIPSNGHAEIYESTNEEVQHASWWL